MIVLDTNVISEVMKPRPHTSVIEWLDHQAGSSLSITTISLSELVLGIELLADGRRKREMGNALRAMLEKLFGSRILPFDTPCAAAYAELVSQGRYRGLAVAVQDGQIAAIAKSRGFAVATRDVGPFMAAGLEVINPWEA